ncbi:MAG: Ribonuclease BN [Candidatus Jettenia ecosi]|uniref:Ribonuclease BN n=1 Tax=Candidatus Jettenia ecosi TaxID=2494326 RepID=A0A533QC61_9BACT|nr:MAG: Ribonuclease BN [Candidatus Jettenia ecosi]
MRFAKFKSVIGFIKTIFSEFSEDKASRLAAAMAYYAVFSLAPLLIIAIAIIGFVFGKEAAQGKIVEQMQGLVGESGAKVMQSMIEATSKPKSGLIATVLGVAALMFGAGRLFAQLQDALNTIWEVVPKPGRDIMSMVRERFLSLTLVLGTGFLLLVSLILTAGLESFGNYLVGILPGLDYILQILNLVVSFAVITLLFAMIFKLLPDVKIAWNDVWIGAVMTTVLFIIGKYFIGLYLGRSSTTSAYGAAGSLIIILLWNYYAAMILLLGAEFAQVYANKYGSRVVPAEHAIPITDEMRSEQGIPRTKDVKTRPTGRREIPRPAYAAQERGKSYGGEIQPSGKPHSDSYALGFLCFIAGMALGNRNGRRTGVKKEHIEK